MTGDGAILVGGEALFDLVATDDEHLAAHAGGGPFNTARTIGRLEQPVAFLGRLSSDRFGARLERLLAEDGVRLDAVVRTDDPTTLALAELDATGSARYRFYERGTSAPGLTTEDALAALPPDPAFLHVGTLGLTLEPMATAYEAVVERLGGAALVSLDPNCRPWGIPDEGEYRARLRRMLARSDLVKVSEEDVAWLDPDRTPVEATRALLDDGPPLALLTRGPDGAVVITRTAEVSVPAPRARVVDTIGAGDAFCGGFIAWWRMRDLGRDELTHVDTVVKATRFACLVAARTCGRPGASPPYLSEVEEEARAG